MVESIGDSTEPASIDGLKQTASWTQQKSDLLQSAVDKIFGTGATSLLAGLDFSFTIADPQLEGCPLIGCSTGFTVLCGYAMAEIVGRNCRFLVDPVPDELVDQTMRVRCREFCVAARDDTEFRLPAHELDPWLPDDRPPNELFAMQKNARKDGSLFNNMFYMKKIGLGDFDEEKQYLVALQSDLPGGRSDLAQLGTNLRQLDKNMAQVEKILAQEFIISGPMRRQHLETDEESADCPDKDTSDAHRLIPARVIGA